MSLIAPPPPPPPPLLTLPQLCEEIAAVIREYQNRNYDATHVETWIAQFDEPERRIVLEETKRLLKGNYLTLSDFKNFIEQVVEYLYVIQRVNWNCMSFLDLQKNGSSQRELVALMQRYVSVRAPHSLSGIHVNQYANINTFVYLDDVVFSGNRLYQDLRDWIETTAPNDCTVYIPVMGYYVYGQWKTHNLLVEAANNANKNINFIFRCLGRAGVKENRVSQRNGAQVFWPMPSVAGEPGVTQFLEGLTYPFSYRNFNFSSTFGASRRERFENIMVKYGLRIIGFSADPHFLLKPLGYSSLDGFGFGATTFSYRNCPNNAPLAFWWGDANADSWSPLSRWYPLMPRITY
ncbi:TPA: hypothetical protein NGR42_003895 [Vibrio parahaemolyticus]|uniref:phosphoribosyltransferase-like protein n=1 Tax=Vibrio nigripulchritudo TaxID=28173 RepID=UPI00248F8CA5|nr:hypothetical protein [Vibrio nigripulchritudo]BDU38108.1 hypothetical protein TUMSATVNIG2_25770 [Vibrio nigripulchritudo]BDU43831.1 hypothetical protein TUMSATVNIG3_26290 [Vibrio nigripulchritudo]HCE3019798.1 hypothetical protein [Vibrio parahaemolyticus]HCE4479453.1 hypothetical protein [Vibrio parahaemolyticus]